MYKVGDLVLYKSMYLYECISVSTNEYKFKLIYETLTLFSEPFYITCLDGDKDIELIKVDSALFNLDTYFKSIYLSKSCDFNCYENCQSISCGDLIFLYIESLNKSVFGVIYSNKLALTEYGLINFGKVFLKVFWLSPTIEYKYKQYFNGLCNKKNQLDLLYSSKLKRGLLFQGKNNDFYIHLGNCRVYKQLNLFNEKEINLYLGKSIKCFDSKLSTNLGQVNQNFFEVDFNTIFILNYIDISYINTIEIVQDRNSIKYIINMEQNSYRTLMKVELIK